MSAVGVYIYPLIFVPVVIVDAGRYRTRAGEAVEVEAVSTRHDFQCTGYYSNGVSESWHKSGRLYAGVLSDNDIVARA